MSATTLHERHVLITGAAQRLGRHMALHLAAQGWNIALHYHHSHAQAHNTAQEIRALGVRCTPLQANLANAEDCAKLVPQAVNILGHLDAVVNNASVFSQDEASAPNLALWQTHMDINLRAPWLLAQSLYAHVCATSRSSRPRACVINVLDQKVFNLNPDFFSYTLSKQALEAMTRTLATALAPQIRICGLAPGLTLVSGEQTPAQFAWAHQQTPLGHSSTPEDVAEALAWLLQAKAVTGTTVLVDGGQHLQASPRDVMFLQPTHPSL